MDPGEGYRDCTWREGAASSAQCSLCLREASWSWVSSLLCKEDSALFLLCFSLGSSLSQTSLILFSPFPSFFPQSLPLTPCVLPSLGYKAILILKLHIGDQTSKTILFLCLFGLDCWPHSFHFYSFGSNIHLLHCTLYFCSKIFCFCFFCILSTFTLSELEFDRNFMLCKLRKVLFNIRWRCEYFVLEILS